MVGKLQLIGLIATGIIAWATLPGATAQSLDKRGALQGFEPTDGILGNSVSNVFISGDSVWAGPFLSMTPDGGETWLVPDIDPVVLGDRNRVFSIDIEGSTIWVGLG